MEKNTKCHDYRNLLSVMQLLVEMIDEEFEKQGLVKWLNGARTLYVSQMEDFGKYLEDVGQRRDVSVYRERELELRHAVLDTYCRYNLRWFKRYHFVPVDETADCEGLSAFYREMYDGVWEKLAVTLGFGKDTSQVDLCELAGEEYVVHLFGRALRLVKDASYEVVGRKRVGQREVLRAIRELTQAEAQGRPLLRLKKQWWVVMRVLECYVPYFEGISAEKFSLYADSHGFGSAGGVGVPCTLDSMKAADDVKKGYPLKFRETKPADWNDMPKDTQAEWDDIILAGRLMELLGL